MGMLVNGLWDKDATLANAADGRFIRATSAFQNWVTRDGSAGPTGEGGFAAEAGRYHLYVSLACPWAHRTLIFRKLKGLEKIISVSIVHWQMRDNGWTFEPGADVVPDFVNQKNFLHEVYSVAAPQYTGKVTVPVLWDKKKSTIVSNESADIIRMFNSAFDDVGALTGDYYPENLRAEIDTINEYVYHNINNGVYKAGFATSQEAYEQAFSELFNALDFIEERLSFNDYLISNEITEADIRLFTTLVRFDAVYFGHFKCNKKNIRDYKNIYSYVKRIYNFKKISETVNFDHIKRHYYESHLSINPLGIVPLGPEIDFS